MDFQRYNIREKQKEKGRKKEKKKKERKRIIKKQTNKQSRKKKKKGMILKILKISGPFWCNGPCGITSKVVPSV